MTLKSLGKRQHGATLDSSNVSATLKEIHRMVYSNDRPDYVLTLTS